jgi:hypothetical protein
MSFLAISTTPRSHSCIRGSDRSKVEDGVEDDLTFSPLLMIQSCVPLLKDSTPQIRFTLIVSNLLRSTFALAGEGMEGMELPAVRTGADFAEVVVPIPPDTTLFVGIEAEAPSDTSSFQR